MDELGRTTSFSYDRLGRLLTVTDALGQTTSNVYDSFGNLVSSTDRRGGQTRFEYDALNRVILARAPEIRFPVPYGAFYVFFDATPFLGTWSGGREIRDSVALAAHLLDAHGLAVVPGAAFDDDTGIRVSYTLPEEDLRRGLELLVKVLRARA